MMWMGHTNCAIRDRAPAALCLGLDRTFLYQLRRRPPSPSLRDGEDLKGQAATFANLASAALHVAAAMKAST